MAIGEDLVMTDDYLPGAAVLAHSLRDAGTTKKLAVLVTLESLRSDTVEELSTLYDYVLPVDRIPNRNPANLYLIDRGDLLYAFTKIHLWRLMQFRKIVYIDADVVSLRAPDELFETKESFAAASDIGWPDFFNSGVMVLSPNMGTYWALQTLAASSDSFDGADQGLLNQYFEHKNWKRLPFTYNCTPSASYQYEPAYRYHKSNISMVHFIGQSKPWQKGRTMSQKGSGAYKELVNRWWAVYDMHYKFTTYDSASRSRGNLVKSFVTGEATPRDYGYSAGPIEQSSQQESKQNSQPQSELPVVPAEAPSSDHTDHFEQIVHEQIVPTATGEQKSFSAPFNEWDATRAPPPEASKPEAVNLPTHAYEFNADPTPYQPPQSYPEPPKDMWYEVPKEKPLPAAAKPKPIFPWEEREATKPTRIFIEDSLPTARAVSNADDPGLSRASTNDKSTEATTPTTPTIQINDGLPQTMGPITRNVWDDVAGIDSYVRELNKWQKLRGKLQDLQNEHSQSHYSDAEGTNPLDEAVVSPDGESAKGTATTSAHGDRRESLILTKFPSADERPSLPVTPAPIKRNFFWGAERDDQGQLPPADGVPNQADWDPHAQLESLRQASLALKPESLQLHAKNVPRRDMPSSSIDIGQHPGLIGQGMESPENPPSKRGPGGDQHHHVHFGDKVAIVDEDDQEPPVRVREAEVFEADVRGGAAAAAPVEETRVSGDGGGGGRAKEAIKSREVVDKGAKGGVAHGPVTFAAEVEDGPAGIVTADEEILSPKGSLVEGTSAA